MWETVHSSTPIEPDDRLESWKDDAPVREQHTPDRGVRLVYVDGRDREVVRR